MSTSTDASISSGIHLNLINEFTDILSMSWIQPGDIWPKAGLESLWEGLEPDGSYPGNLMK